MKKQNLESSVKKEKSPNKVMKAMSEVITGEKYRNLCRIYSELANLEFPGIKRMKTTTDPLTHKPIPYFPKVGYA